MPLVKFVLIALIIIFLLTTWLNRPNSSLPTIELEIGTQTFSLEKATTTLEHSRGLSGRTTLCPECGMIFIFKNEMVRSFWMKNTLIPLDMVFLDKTGQINTILTALPQPGATDLALKIYSSVAPAQYVIELPSGTARKLKLSPGTRINLARL